MTIILTSLLVFTALALCGYAISGFAVEREQAKDALDRRLTAMAGTPSVNAGASVLKDRRLSGIGLFNKILTRVSIVDPFVRMIRQAGLKRRAGEVLLYIPLLGSLAFLLVMLLLGRLLFACVAAGFAAVAPLIIISRMRSKRLALFGEQLPDALDLIRAALQAGHGFVSALQVVADEFPDPIAGELREVAEEMRLGLSMREALYHLMERMNDPNLPILTVGVLITQEVGGNLAEVLNNVSYTIRERFKLIRETRVMTAQGRLSGLVLTALPFLVAVGLFFLNPSYFLPMLQTRTGLMMIGYALMSLLMGHLFIQRIVRIRI